MIRLLTFDSNPILPGRYLLQATPRRGDWARQWMSGGRNERMSRFRAGIIDKDGNRLITGE